MRTRLLPLHAVTPSDARAWRRLADTAVEPNVYLDPRFLLPARDRGHETDDLRLVVVEERGEWLALLAVTTKQIGLGVPVRAATTGGTFMTTHSDRHHPLVRIGRETEALHALLRGIRSSGLPGLVQLQHFPADGPLADALATIVGATSMRAHERRRVEAACATRGSVPAPVPVPALVGAGAPGLPTAPPGPVVVDPPLHHEHMGSGRRKDVRRRARALARAAGGPLALHDVSADPAADDAFVALQASGWKGDAGQGGAALALDPVAQRWFREVVGAFRADGDALVLRLDAGGCTQWTGYSLRSGGTYFGFLDAYAEEHRQHSPGALGRLAEISYLFAATDAPALDPAFDARYVTGAQLYPDRRTYADVLVSTGGVVARTAVRAAPVARRLGFGAGAVGMPLAPEHGAELEELLRLLTAVGV
ncbi:GNAT family N-acetyltransferase [Cellulomonas triticagri]|uniref:GNAT family N-acetyltransferase n=1 Tax=Cellulomonas triticagri TaxID=2483352 RepID=A0A3M2JFK8_9CELL|nr:GNAT family N-acetyltransferase [Cellulomonas triticagri]RMI12552.1 GNAT family N-acetyltransferase [Cellulomonas triticagri]